MPTPRPFDLGNVLATAEGIKNARYSRDPNSLANQLLAAKIGSANALGGGIGTYNPRDYTADSWSQFIDTKDPRLLKRFATLRPMTVDGLEGMGNVITGEFFPKSTIEGKTKTEEAMSAASERGKLLQQKQLVPEIKSLTITQENEARAGLGGGVSDADLARGTTIAKGQGERHQEWINVGLAAADSIPTVMRGIELLENGVKTGGFDNLKLWATDTFGITDADEGELSANLGKAVLSQLRSTFGAAFTEREGDRLARIEAGFGKSPAVNLRLLKQLEKIARKEAQRGISAARSTKDNAAAQAIQDALNFSLSPANETVPQNDGESYEQRKARILGQ
jgi:hypothetical protein